MKLYEFSALIHVSMVVAAKSREAAEKHVKEGYGPNGWAAIADAIDVSDVELVEERELRGDPLDEAHAVIE